MGSAALFAGSCAGAYGFSGRRRAFAAAVLGDRLARQNHRSVVLRQRGILLFARPAIEVAAATPPVSATASAIAVAITAAAKAALWAALWATLDAALSATIRLLRLRSG